MFKAVVISGLCGMLLAGSGAWYVQDLRWTRKGALRTAQIQSEHAQAISALRAKELAAQGRVDALASLYDKQKEVYSHENANLLARVHAGTVRLRLPAAVPAAACPGAPEAPGGADAAGSCELSAGTTASLFAIAERADACALKLNALQEYVRGLTEEARHGTVVE